jgi:hypothetical protein
MQGYLLRFVTVSDKYSFLLLLLLFVVLSQHTEPTGGMAAGYDKR